MKWRSTCVAISHGFPSDRWAGAGGRREVRGAVTVPSCAAGHGRPAAVRLRPFCQVSCVPGPLPGSQGDGRRPAAPSPRGRARKDASRLPQHSLYGHGATSPAGPQRWLFPSPFVSPERLRGCCPGACPERGSHSARGLRVLSHL